MPLASGARIGPYEIVSALGAGGMGEVYRAKDSKLKREVALKVLPADVANDRERLARFQREAEVLASLNHPHIAQIHGLEESNGVSALVMELVEGEDLAQRIARGPIPLDEALPIAKQIAEALEAAHDAGVIHRDLKPANIKVRADGTVKVLDFGLARTSSATGAKGASSANSPTFTSAGMTMHGVILGTAAYMAPEQAKGKIVDKRADIWAFGCVLYEMLSGRKAFDGEDITDTIVAVVSRQPDWTALPATVPARVRATLQRCLEKDSRRRLRDVGDARLTFDDAPDQAVPVAPQPRAGRSTLVAAVVMLAIGLGAGWLAARALSSPAATPVNYQRLTFQRGTVHSARFDTAGREVVYAAAWDGSAVNLFSTLIGSNETQTPGLPPVDVLSVSERGELLVLQKDPGQQWREPAGRTGTLLRSSRGGAARTLADNVLLADWMPDGENVAALRRDGGQWAIERPLGTVIRKSSNLVNGLRISPDGEWLAIAEKALGYGSLWSIVFIDKAGNERAFDARAAGDFFDLAWAPNGREIWFNAYQGADPEWRAMDTNGNSRLLLRTPTPLRIMDVAADGRVLAERSNARYGVMGLAPGDSRERDYSWLDSTEVDAISGDGRTLLLTEFGEGVGFTTWAVGVRTLERPGVVRLGSGQAFGLSPDGKWALTMRQGLSSGLVLLPTGAGAPVELPRGDLVNFVTGTVTADGSHIVFSGSTKNIGSRYFRQAIKGGLPEPLMPPDRAGEFAGDLGGRPVSPDGKTLAAVDRQRRLVLFGINGSGNQQGTIVPQISNVDTVQRWSVDGCCVYIRETNLFPATIRKVDVATGNSTVLRRLDSIDPVGLTALYAIHISDDERSYYYTFQRVMSDLFIVEGVK